MPEPILMGLAGAALYNYIHPKGEGAEPEEEAAEEDTSLVNRIRSASTVAGRQLKSAGSVLNEQIARLRQEPGQDSTAQHSTHRDPDLHDEGGEAGGAAAGSFAGYYQSGESPHMINQSREEAMMADAMGSTVGSSGSLAPQRKRGVPKKSKRSKNADGEKEISFQGPAIPVHEFEADISVNVEVPRNAKQILNISAGCLFQFKKGEFQVHHAGPLMALICGTGRHYVLLLYNFKRERVLGVELGSSFLCGYWDETEDNFFVPPGLKVGVFPRLQLAFFDGAHQWRLQFRRATDVSRTLAAMACVRAHLLVHGDTGRDR
jgi:hypothetical protein